MRFSDSFCGDQTFLHCNYILVTQKGGEMDYRILTIKVEKLQITGVFELQILYKLKKKHKIISV